MSQALVRALSVLGVLAFAIAGCNDFGYVEVKAVPAGGRAPSLYLDGERVSPPRDGIAVLRQAVGTRTLQTEAGGGQFAALCDIVVRKDRITTVMISTLERPPRCTCSRVGDGDPKGRRVCIG
jgi:hypothetical protein